MARKKMKEKEIILLRGHHLRVLRFYRNRYLRYSVMKRRVQCRNSVKYYGNLHADKVVEIAKKIRRPADGVFFKIINRIDDICRACKKRRCWECCRSGRIKTPDGVKLFHTAAKEDKETARRLGLEIGKTYSAKEILEILR
jgi:hypothetical protein